MTQWAQYGSIAMDAIGVLAGAESSAAGVYDQTYQTVSSGLARRTRAKMVIDAAHKNIAAVKQDQVTANRRIADDRAAAIADAKVAAAFAGVEGNSVEATEYNASANASLATEATNKRANQQQEDLLNSIHGAAYEHAASINLPSIQTDWGSIKNSAMNIWDNVDGKKNAEKLWSRYFQSDEKKDQAQFAADEGNEWRIL